MIHGPRRLCLVSSMVLINVCDGALAAADEAVAFGKQEGKRRGKLSLSKEVKRVGRAKEPNTLQNYAAMMLVRKDG